MCVPIMDAAAAGRKSGRASPATVDAAQVRACPLAAVAAWCGASCLPPAGRRMPETNRPAGCDVDPVRDGKGAP